MHAHARYIYCFLMRHLSVNPRPTVIELLCARFVGNAKTLSCPPPPGRRTGKATQGTVFNGN